MTGWGNGVVRILVHTINDDLYIIVAPGSSTEIEMYVLILLDTKNKSM